jgi:hypothetical protein
MSATYTLHARLRVRRAPGIPHALCFRGEWIMRNSGAPRREVGKVRLRTTPLLFEN